LLYLRLQGDDLLRRRMSMSGREDENGGKHRRRYETIAKLGFCFHRIPVD
jgi:hypothetical protein